MNQREIFKDKKGDIKAVESCKIYWLELICEKEDTKEHPVYNRSLEWGNAFCCGYPGSEFQAPKRIHRRPWSDKIPLGNSHIHSTVVHNEKVRKEQTEANKKKKYHF